MNFYLEKINKYTRYCFHISLKGSCYYNENNNVVTEKIVTGFSFYYSEDVFNINDLKLSLRLSINEYLEKKYKNKFKVKKYIHFNYVSEIYVYDFYKGACVIESDLTKIGLSNPFKIIGS